MELLYCCNLVGLQLVLSLYICWPSVSCPFDLIRIRFLTSINMLLRIPTSYHAVLNWKWMQYLLCKLKAHYNVAT